MIDSLFFLQRLPSPVAFHPFNVVSVKLLIFLPNIFHLSQLQTLDAHSSGFFIYCVDLPDFQLSIINMVKPNVINFFCNAIHSVVYPPLWLDYNWQPNHSQTTQTFYLLMLLSPFYKIHSLNFGVLTFTVSTITVSYIA